MCILWPLFSCKIILLEFQKLLTGKIVLKYRGSGKILLCSLAFLTKMR